MNRRTWKEFITKRSTIWTLSLCLVGAIVLGGMAAVNRSRSNDDAQTETEPGQIAYLEEELDGESTNDEDTDVNSNDVDAITGDDGSGIAAKSSESSDSANGEAAEDSSTDVSTDLILGDDSGTVSGTGADESSDDTASGTADSSDDVISDAAASSDGSDSGTDDSAAESSDISASDSEEASSASIISEQALIDAGVSFTDDQSLLWPSAGTIVIDYSMDKSVYFQTLNQYKYNPALIISSDAGNQVLAAAKGIVESISVDEETGTTLVLNIGNGYRLTYGQLMEPAVSEGDVVESGDLLAYISEPTKYYSTEGSNLYFAMTKDGEPVDPVLYLE